jgi:UDP-N-acetylglucosamine 1-carboxyvinyltransferase
LEKFIIEGGTPLAGEIATSGAKNSALPALAACLLTDETVTLERIPRVRDIRTMEELLRYTGARVKLEDGVVRVDAGTITHSEAPYDVVKTMRASSLVLGPLVGRCGRARVSLPGGCAIGGRPINLHVLGLEKLGARIRQEHGYIEAEAPDGLKGAEVHFDRITVTGTEDLIMAAVLARGETVIHNAAREPEVVDLCALLTKMGAKIEGAGTSIIRVQGVSKLRGARHAIIPDRIEAGTFLIAGAITRGDVVVTGCEPEHLRALIAKMEQAGVEVTQPSSGALRVRVPGKLKSVDVTTEEHPGFATDLQAQFMALMTQAEGISIITETIFENRFMHAQELARMGANIRLDGRRALVAGPMQGSGASTPLSGAQVIASDLRASASLVLAALAASGETVVDRVYHIDRGYEAIETKLAGAGARIRRVSDKHLSDKQPVSGKQPVSDKQPASDKQPEETST